MAEKQQMQAPSGMAGLVRYYEDEKSLIKLKPQHVVAICSFLVVLEIILYTMFPL
ncbi:MAG: preprotein translocase subunit Sec61beta [Candidatus Aenigmatarchaeota archaeon]